jgi:hypothetical protein
MKKLILSLFLIPSIVFGADKKISELTSTTSIGEADIIMLVSTNLSGGGGYTNYSISWSNLWFNIRAKIGGVITNNTGAISNAVTASITNLLSVTITTNFLDSSGDSIHFTSGGNFANSSSAKSVLVALGTTTLFQATNILNTLGITNGFVVSGDITRLSANSYVSSVSLVSLAGSAIAGAGTNYSSAFTTIGSESLVTNNILAIQTRAITAGDVTNHFLRLENKPQP